MSPYEIVAIVFSSIGLLISIISILDNFHYHFLLTSVLGEANYFTTPLPDYYFIKRELKKLNTEHQKIIAFLLLGEPIEKDLLENCLDADLLRHLFQLEIINYDEEQFCYYLSTKEVR